LGGGLTVIAKPHDVLARLEMGGDADDVANSVPVPVDTRASRAGLRKLWHASTLVAVWFDGRHLVASRAVGTRCTGARSAVDLGVMAAVDAGFVRKAVVRRGVGVVGAGDAAGSEEGGRHRDERPCGADREGPLVDKGGLGGIELEHCPVGKYDGLQHVQLN